MAGHKQVLAALSAYLTHDQRLEQPVGANRCRQLVHIAKPTARVGVCIGDDCFDPDTRGFPTLAYGRGWAWYRLRGSLAYSCDHVTLPPCTSPNNASHVGPGDNIAELCGQALWLASDFMTI